MPTSDQTPEEKLRIALLNLNIIELAAPFGDVRPEELREARMEYMKLSGNANPYVPWDTPGVDYQCGCGDIITCDQPHIHPGDGQDVVDMMSVYEAEAEYAREHDIYK